MRCRNMKYQGLEAGASSPSRFLDSMSAGRPWALALLLGLVFVISQFLPLRAAAYPPIRDMTGAGLAITSSTYATKVGKDVLDSGGNAIDAAVAIGYALAVTHPAAGNIGGGGFALIHLANGETVALDFRETAPMKATRDMFLDKKGNVIPNASVIGHLSAGVPGTVKGLNTMLEKYGTKKLEELIQPAINLAENGFVVTDRQAETMLEVKNDFAKFAGSRKYFLKKDGSTYKGGETLVQKDLAKTLRLIQKEGEDAFYKGKIADMIVEDMKNNGGLLTKEDLSNYKVVWRKPVRGTYRGYEIISMSPPSSGGTHIIQILNTLEYADMKGLGFNSVQSIHLMAEAMKQAYADRATYMGDPDFFEIPVEKLLSKDYAKRIYDNIMMAKKATPSGEITPGLGLIEESKAITPNTKESDQTTHYSVADKWGNAVSVTYTLNKRYGSAAAITGAGFIMNDQMENFSIKPGHANRHGLVEGESNSIAPNKRPLSSMSPTIILKDGQLFMVIGTPGSGKIGTTIVQVISNVIDHGMNIARAISMSRFHHQWSPDELAVEVFAINKDTQSSLEKLGHNIAPSDDMCDVNAIVRDLETGTYYGANDPRRKL